MIPIDSKSYPYLAVAQHSNLDYGYLMLYSIETIRIMQQNIHKTTNIKIDNSYAREVWNAAIEEALYFISDHEFGILGDDIRNKIRKLKINVDKGK